MNREDIRHRADDLLGSSYEAGRKQGYSEGVQATLEEFEEAAAGRQVGAPIGGTNGESKVEQSEPATVEEPEAETPTPPVDDDVPEVAAVTDDQGSALPKSKIQVAKEAAARLMAERDRRVEVGEVAEIAHAEDDRVTKADARNAVRWMVQNGLAVKVGSAYQAVQPNGAT